jgi:hypothetical protein
LIPSLILDKVYNSAKRKFTLKKWLLFSFFVLFILSATACNIQSVTPSNGGNQLPISQGKPDLSVEMYQVHYAGCPWTEGGEIRGWIQNRGTASSPAFEVSLDGTRVQAQSLESGMGEWVVAPFNKGPVGFIEIIADPDSKIDDANRENNAYNIVFTPPPPCATPDPNETPVPIATLPAIETFTVILPANDPWFYLDPYFYRGEIVHIKVTAGTWRYAEDVESFGADGNPKQKICAFIQPGAQCSEPLPNERTGALIGAFNPPQFFLIGSEASFTVTQEGYLTLRMNYDGNEDARKGISGELTLEVTITRGQ